MCKKLSFFAMRAKSLELSVGALDQRLLLDMHFLFRRRNAVPYIGLTAKTTPRSDNDRFGAVYHAISSTLTLLM